MFIHLTNLFIDCDLVTKWIYCIIWVLQIIKGLRDADYYFLKCIMKSWTLCSFMSSNMSTISLKLGTLCSEYLKTSAVYDTILILWKAWHFDFPWCQPSYISWSTSRKTIFTTVMCLWCLNKFKYSDICHHLPIANSIANETQKSNAHSKGLSKIPILSWIITIPLLMHFL